MIPRLVRLFQNVTTLFRARVELTKQEAWTAARHMLIGVAYLGMAIVLLLIALPLIVVTVVLALATVLPAWAATGIVLAVTVLVAGVLVLAARRRFAQRRGGRFMNGLREDLKTVRDHLESRG